MSENERTDKLLRIQLVLSGRAGLRRERYFDPSTGSGQASSVQVSRTLPTPQSS